MGSFSRGRHTSVTSNTSDPSLCNHYRLSTQKKNDITVITEKFLSTKTTGDNITDSTSLPYTRSLLFFSGLVRKHRKFVLLKELNLIQVLHLDDEWEEKHVKQLAPQIHLRHIKVVVYSLRSLPISISNMWNMQTLIVEIKDDLSEVDMPESLWRMKTLRHVKVTRCKLTFSDESHEHKACPQLDNVVSFSSPILYTGKDVEGVLQRLPVRELSCFLDKYLDSNEERVETLDFYRKLESLKLAEHPWKRSALTYLINFPSTLKKLTLERFQLPWMAISAVAELQCLQVLKLRQNSFPEPLLEMDDVAFPSLEFFELYDEYLLQWDASVESFPCLEQLLIQCQRLEELPECFGEISTLKRIVVRNSQKLESSALQVQEEQMELGKKVEVSIYHA